MILFTILCAVVMSQLHISLVLASRDTEIPPCSGHTSCASCTNSRYYNSEYDLSYQPMNEPDFFLRPMISALRGKLLSGEQFPTCRWHGAKEGCLPYTTETDLMKASFEYIVYEYDCPMFPQYPGVPPPFLPQWMSSLMKIPSFSSLPLSNLSLPGTHDSISYDLSLTISKDGLDDFENLSVWLRRLSKIRPGEVEEFIRLEALSQKLDIVQQLDNGIRFIDFRLMKEDNNWFSLHCMQSKFPAVVYLKAIRKWMDANNGEFLVIWLSRDGNTDSISNDAYPSVSLEEKQTFWSAYLNVFRGLLFDTSISDYTETPMSELLLTNQRIITFTSDYEEFTNSSKYAYDAKKISNFFHADGVFDEESTIKRQRDYFKKEDKSTTQGDRVDDKRWFSLMSMNTPSNTWQVESAARHRFLPIDLFESCTKHVNIPGNDDFCPATLLDIVQLSNYYNQITIEEAYQGYLSGDNISLPNAFYIDGIDYNGTLRTGTQLLDGFDYRQSLDDYKLTRYAFVDTVIGYNIHTASRSANITEAMSDESAYADMMRFIEERRTLNPLILWDEKALGRRDDWP